MQRQKQPIKIPEELKKVLSMSKEDFNTYIGKWEEEYGVENGIIVHEELKEVALSAGQPNFNQVLFDEKSKSWVRIQFGRKGNDYIYHIFFKKSPPVGINEISQKIYESVAEWLPRDPEKIVNPPMKINDFAEPYYIECYTLLVKNITKFNGSRRMMEELFVHDLLDKLNSLFPEIKNA